MLSFTLMYTLELQHVYCVTAQGANTESNDISGTCLQAHLYTEVSEWKDLDDEKCFDFVT